jgi:hypothetical protein
VRVHSRLDTHLRDFQRGVTQGVLQLLGRAAWYLYHTLYSNTETLKDAVEATSLRLQQRELEEANQATAESRSQLLELPATGENSQSQMQARSGDRLGPRSFCVWEGLVLHLLRITASNNVQSHILYCAILSCMYIVILVLYSTSNHTLYTMHRSTPAACRYSTY